LMRSHQLQICTNFMDPGLQVYGGELFRELRDKGDQIFLTLPKPKPSNARASVTSTTQNRSNSPDMNRYYAGAGGGCFGETSSVIVVTNDGMEVKTRVSDVRPGDEVRVADEGLAKVRCVVRIAYLPARSWWHCRAVLPSPQNIQCELLVSGCCQGRCGKRRSPTLQASSTTSSWISVISSSSMA